MTLSKLRDESGQAAPLVAVTLLGLLAVTALVIDGGLLFAAKRGLQSLADGAARAGAMAVDERSLRESGGQTVVLDPLLAEQAVADYLEISGYDGDIEASASATSVRVLLRTRHSTVLMSLVGIHDVETGASAFASPRTGTAGG